MQSIKLSPKVIEQLGYYVYLYINPIDNLIFYVGKGKGNRALAHLNDTSETQKAKVIKDIRARVAYLLITGTPPNVGSAMKLA